MMGDLRDPRLIYLKGILFVLSGLLAFSIVLLEHPSAKLAILMAIAIWCFARSYYFAFYVIEHYVDGEFRYAGVSSFLRYVVGRRVKESEGE